MALIETAHPDGMAPLEVRLQHLRRRRRNILRTSLVVLLTLAAVLVAVLFGLGLLLR